MILDANNTANKNASFTVCSINCDQTYPLRSRVLRPGLPLQTCLFDGDQDTSTQHWGAFVRQSSKASECVGIASVYQRPCFNEQVAPEWQYRLSNSENAQIFQLRGMATSPTVRGSGCGRAILQMLALELLNHPDALLWANARSEAIGFYQRCGYQVVSEVFMIEGVGPHYVIVRAASL